MTLTRPFLCLFESVWAQYHAEPLVVHHWGDSQITMV